MEIDSERARQGSRPGQQSNKRALPVLIKIVRQGLGTYFESEAVSTSATSNGHWSTAPDEIDHKTIVPTKPSIIHTRKNIVHWIITGYNHSGTGVGVIYCIILP